MKDPEMVRDVVLKEVDMAQLMVDYGVSFTFDPSIADEVQFRCPFHGKDNKPSARYYSETKSCFCWYCKKRWDAISFVRDKENLSYGDAVNHLVRKYRVDLSGIPEKPTLNMKQKEVVSGFNVQIRYIRQRLRANRGKFPFEKYRSLVGALFMAVYEQNEGNDVLPLLLKIEKKINQLENA